MAKSFIKMTSNTNGISRKDMTDLFLSQNGFVSLSVDDGFLGEENIVKCISILAGACATSLRGHIPNLTGNSTVFTPSASSVSSSNYAAWKAFNNSINSWRVASGVTTNFWIRIDLPNPVAVYRFSLSGWITTLEEVDCIKDWIFQALDTNFDQWVNLCYANNKIIDASKIYFFDVPSITDPTGILHLETAITYKSYRIMVQNCTPGSSTPGLSHFQI